MNAKLDDAPISLARRRLLQAGGALLVSFSANLPLPGVADAAGKAVRPPLVPEQLDSFIALRPDGGFTVYFGKVDMGLGVDTAVSQMVADELDVELDQIHVIMGDTGQTVDQGGASGSWAVEKGGGQLRYAAAEARRILIERAAQRLGVPADGLDTRDGDVFLTAQPAKRISYKALMGDGYFRTPLTWNGQLGNNLLARGKARPKSPSQYRIVGQSAQRASLRDNVFGQLKFVTDVRLHGMLHARVIRPPVVGAEPQTIDKASVKDIPGVRIVHERGLLAVLAEKEWNAIRAASLLDVTWTTSADRFPDQAKLYDHIRAAPVLKRNQEHSSGDLAGAMVMAAKTVTATYEWPFQSHACIVGACAVADVRADGATVWTGSQKPHAVRNGVARILDLPPEKVRAIWSRGPGSYGRNDAGDAALEAAHLSRVTGRPVRLQYTRQQGTGWDPKGPATVHTCKAALDADGNVIAYQVENRGFSRTNVMYNEEDPRDSLVGQLLGKGQNSTEGLGSTSETYRFPAALYAWETVPPLVKNASPLRTGHLRDPVGPQVNFAGESFIDELAAATGTDPVEFRLRYQHDPRAVAAIKAAADKFGWTPRVAASQVARSGPYRGRGFALAQRYGTIVAVAVEVEINRETGALRQLRWAAAHDCGQVINPHNLRLMVEGNIIQSGSRSLHEEVTFDREKVTSIDWMSYPILDSTEAPERIYVVLLDRPEIPPTGAGEGATRPVPAALANAIFDATGVRLRRAPFTAERIKAALSAKA